MTDRVLGRLSYEPSEKELTPIPWPEGLAPTLVKSDHWTGDPLVKVDVLVVTWTSAEWMALADVLSPGREKGEWQAYGRNWGAFEPHLTGRSPAKEAKCLGEYTYVTIADKLVCLFHSQLHLATDDDTAPIVALWQQLITEAEPELVITTGTAGGIGATEVLGDVFVVQGAKFNCTKMFKSKPWAQQHFGSLTGQSTGANFDLVDQLIAVNAGRLPSDLTPRTPRTSVGGDVETVDYFGFDDTDDSYGIVADDANAQTEEMDDATLPLALSGLATPLDETRWLSIRNASDPQVPSSIGDLEAQSKWASDIYEKWGYTTTIGSALACWGVIADLA